MNKLVDREDKVLREIAKDVPLKDIGSEKLTKILSDMKKALHAEEDGVAIAAPQIGVPLRIFVVSKRVFDIKEKLDVIDGKKEDAKNSKKEKAQKDDLVFINPKITKTSKDSAWMVEGCLSLRWLYGNVKRKKRASIEAYNEKGEKISRGAGGLLAQIFQHETDHLDGILFIDHAKDVEDIPPEIQNKYKKENAE